MIHMNSSSEIKAELEEERKKLVKAYGLDYKEVEELYSKLTFLLKNIIRKKSVLATLQKVHINLERGIEYVLEILRLIITSKKFTPKQQSLLLLFCYLEISEGVFSELIQLISFILIQNGHDIYDPQRMKFVKSYKELDRVPSFVKSQFIEEHELKFVPDVFDRELRNCIAHLEYIVKDDGAIIDKRTGRKIEDLEGKIRDFSVMILIMLNIYHEISAIFAEEVIKNTET